MMKDTSDECSGMYLSAAAVAVRMAVLLNQKGEKEK